MHPVGCADVRARLLASESLADAGATAHVRDCAPCRELVANGAALAEQLRSSNEVALDIEALWAEASSHRGEEAGLAARVRALPTVKRWLIIVAVMVMVVVGVLAAVPRADLAVYPLARMIGGVVALGLAIVGGVAIVLAPAYRPRRASRRALLLGLAISVPLVLALLPAAHGSHPASLAGVGDDLIPRAAACFGFGAGLSLPVVVAGWLVVRRSEARARVAAALLASAAAVGNLILQVHCPLTAVAHRAAGHASITIAFGLIAAAIWAYFAARRRSGSNSTDRV